MNEKGEEEKTKKNSDFFSQFMDEKKVFAIFLHMKFF
jgi:hypothetical protein